MGLTRTYPIDTALQLEDGAAAITSTQVNSNAAGAAYLDLGDSLVHGAVVIQTSDVDCASDNESYKIELQGGADTSFTAATNAILAMLHLGPEETTGAVPADTTGDSPDAAVYYVPFCNDFGGTTHRYVRLKVTITGTSPTITYVAHLTTQRTMG